MNLSLALRSNDAHRVSAPLRRGVVLRGFRDVMSFISRRPWRSDFEEMGSVRDQIAGGFPCTPFAVA